jgi:hypothetical protein
MAKIKPKVFVIRKVVKATSIDEALKQEAKAKISSIVEVVKSNEQLLSAIGFDGEVVTEDEYDD